jgi:hypothetical protein
MFAIQEFNKVHRVGRDEVWIDPANLVHDIQAIAVDVLVIVLHVPGNLANARHIFTCHKVTRQVKVGRSVTTGLQIAKAV